MELLSIRNLTKRFGGLTAVNDVSFSVHQGMIKGLIGPNGAGKTTLFNLITGVYSICEGSILFMETPVHNTPPYRIAISGITRTFQNIRLFKNLSTYENILTACHHGATYSVLEAILLGYLPKSVVRTTRYFRQESALRQHAEELMEVMGLSDRRNFTANNLPYGLQRRLEIARALALRPKLLLLDEPAAGMNPDETVKLKSLIFSIREKYNLTILLIEHHMDVIMGVCDEIVVLNFGCKLAEGTPSEIQKNPQVQHAYLGVA
ncbi:MAG: ABC transporter ATP-binding protein [Chitinivibrionales bacterium]|nr:ABC transporter ATP-binding protein [Chitinivibrionales bacterium]